LTRILSGMRPTGALHLGHYFGVIRQWLDLQASADCFFFAADWHALTTDYERLGDTDRYTRDMVRDWLACGIDPEQAVIFRQSDVKVHAELHLILSMMTPLGWLERVPSYKDMRQNLTDRTLDTYGFLGYPLLQTADIVLYGADEVPVGEDQVAHLELAREVVRRLHHLVGRTIFVEPKPRLTAEPKIPGTDGRKMSKSYGNAIFLGDDAATIAARTAVMITDPQRVRRSDPGNPDVCDVFALHRAASRPAEVAEIDAACRRAEIGCVECKKRLAASIDGHLAPIRERRAAIDDAVVAEVLARGSAQAAAEAEPVMQQVREAIGLPGDRRP
jgi:tryptophanyl-tRNA synthetase